jgi:hypothetical protein
MFGLPQTTKADCNFGIGSLPMRCAFLKPAARQAWTVRSSLPEK